MLAKIIFLLFHNFFLKCFFVSYSYSVSVFPVFRLLSLWAELMKILQAFFVTGYCVCPLDIRLPDILLGVKAGVFLIDETTEPAAIASLYEENYLLFSRLWMLCLEPACLAQYTTCLALETIIAEMGGTECQMHREGKSTQVLKLSVSTKINVKTFSSVQCCGAGAGTFWPEPV